MIETARSEYDVVIVGAGPNGLAAGITLGRAGLSTVIVEARSSAGGGARTQDLTLPGFHHDVCSAVHPLGVASPAFQSFALERYGLTWLEPPAPLAHVLPDGRAVTLERSIDQTAAQLGPDGDAYQGVFEPLMARSSTLLADILGPLRMPQGPWSFARFGLEALPSMRHLAARFYGKAAPALLAGIAAHGMVPLHAAATASFALVLGLAGHAFGWPIARGGSQAITDALVLAHREQGGELVLGQRVERIEQLPRARAYVLDLTPQQVLAVAGHRLPALYRRRLARFRYGPGVYKMDWALKAPIPWRDPACARAGTVHLSGDFAEISRAVEAVHAGRIAERPFVLLAQPTLFDPTRAPAGMHVAWAYCHVPHGSDRDASEAIEAHIEQFAPGFRELVLARSTRNALQMEQHNPNYVGGDINGGLANLAQLFFRPMARLDPYATPAPDIFLCSSSTPPGGGVHGMCGFWAARSVLARLGKRSAVADVSTGDRNVLSRASRSTGP